MCPTAGLDNDVDRIKRFMSDYKIRFIFRKCRLEKTHSVGVSDLTLIISTIILFRYVDIESDRLIIKHNRLLTLSIIVYVRVNVDFNHLNVHIKNSTIM